jgi:hypothetical protein
VECSTGFFQPTVTGSALGSPAVAGGAASVDAPIGVSPCALDGGGGRAPRDTLAATAGVATGRFDAMLALRL